MIGVREAADHQGLVPHGSALLPSDLTGDQLVAAPVLASVDSLVIEDLSEDEDDASRIVRDRHVVGGWSSGATPTW